MAVSRHNLDPAKASHWVALFRALDERLVAAGMFAFRPGRAAPPEPMAGTGLPAVAGDGRLVDSWVTVLVDGIGRACAEYIDMDKYNRCALAGSGHGDAGHYWFDAPTVPVAMPGRPPAESPLSSQSMADWMDAAADTILACEYTAADHIGYMSYAAGLEYVVPPGEYQAALIDGDGERRANLYARRAGTFLGYVRGWYDTVSGFNTGVDEDIWQTLGSVGEGGGAVLWPPSPVVPHIADLHGNSTAGFQVFPVFAPEFTALGDLIAI